MHKKHVENRKCTKNMLRIENAQKTNENQVS